MNRNKLKRNTFYVMKTGFNGGHREILPARFNSIERAEEYVKLFLFPGNPFKFEIWEEVNDADILRRVYEEF